MKVLIFLFAMVLFGAAFGDEKSEGDLSVKWKRDASGGLAVPIGFGARTAGLNGLGVGGHTTWSGMDFIRRELLRMDLEKWYAEARALENRKNYLVNTINELRLPVHQFKRDASGEPPIGYGARTAGLNGLGAYGGGHTTWYGMDLIQSELLRMDLEKWYAEARTLENRKSYLVNAINELRL